MIVPKSWVPAVEIPYWHPEHMKYKIQFCSGHFLSHLAKGGVRSNWVRWKNPQKTECDVSGCVEMAVKREKQLASIQDKGD